MAKEKIQNSNDGSTVGKTGWRGKKRMIFGLVLLVLVVIFSFIQIITFRTRINEADETSKSLLWRGLQDTYIFCGALVVLALGVTFGTGLMTPKRSTGRRIAGVVVWFLALAVVTEGVYAAALTVDHTNQPRVAENARYLVVPGTDLTVNRTTPELAARLDTATDWWKDHQDSTIITMKATEAVIVELLNEDQETKTVQAAVDTSMKGRVKSQGNSSTSIMKTHIGDSLNEYFPKDENGNRYIPPTVLEQEAKSKNLREAFENLLDMKRINIDENTPIIIVTNSCNMADTVRVAGEVGFTNISRLPGSSSFWGYMENIMWETWLENDPEISII